MPDDLLADIDRSLAEAERNGALQAIRTESMAVEQAGFRFTVRWVSTLAQKDAARASAAGRRDPDFNPFLPPEPALTVGALGEAHLAVLNKFPVITRHLLIVTREFEDQRVALTPADFAALAQVMTPLGGLGFYNGGPDAGASQRHKHLQWVPAEPGGASLRQFAATLPAGLAGGDIASAAPLPWPHVFLRLDASVWQGTPQSAGERLASAFGRACAALGLAANAPEMPPYNLLVERDWMLLVPRRREHCNGISVNALGYAGSLFVRHPEQIETVRAMGPLQLLAGVARER